VRSIGKATSSQACPPRQKKDVSTFHCTSLSDSSPYFGVPYESLFDFRAWKNRVQTGSKSGPLGSTRVHSGPTRVPLGSQLGPKPCRFRSPTVAQSDPKPSQNVHALNLFCTSARGVASALATGRRRPLKVTRAIHNILLTNAQGKSSKIRGKVDIFITSTAGEMVHLRPKVRRNPITIVC